MQAFSTTSTIEKRRSKDILYKNTDCPNPNKFYSSSMLYLKTLK